MKMVLLVLDDVSKLREVALAWREQGAGGVTILESSGLGRLLLADGRDDLPLMPSIRHLLQASETHHRTLFSLLEDDVDLEAFFDATEAVVGSLQRPHSGILFAIPVLAQRGLVKHATREAEE